MSDADKRSLVLALGNDMLGDDAAGLVAARMLRPYLPPDVDLIESCESGLGLLDIMDGYKRALLLDAAVTGRRPVGAIIHARLEDFAVGAPAACMHFASLTDVVALARVLDLAFPEEVHILALEVENPFEFREALSPRVRSAVPHFVRRARNLIGRWGREKSCMSIR